MSPSEFQSLKDSLKKLPGEFKAFIEKRIELFTIEMGERITEVIAHTVYRLTGIAFLALGLILVLFAASNFVGELLGNEGLGFIIVAAPVLLLGVLFFSRRPRSMVRATRDKMLAHFMKDLSEQISNFETGINSEPDQTSGSAEDSDKDKKADVAKETDKDKSAGSVEEEVNAEKRDSEKITN